MASALRNKFVSSVIVLVLSGCAVLLSTGCENSDDRQLASAQACLDQSSTPASADDCVLKVQGMETPAAYLVRCSAHFIAQGFTGARIASAFQGMTNSGSSGTDPAIGLMAYLVFSNTSSMHTADITVNDCQKSGVKSMTRLSLVAQMATTTASLAAGIPLSNFNPDTVDSATLVNNLKSAITNATTLTDDKKVALGTVALNLNASLCTDGSSFKDQDVCKYMSTAISGTDGSAAAVANAFFQILQTKQ